MMSVPGLVQAQSWGELECQVIDDAHREQVEIIGNLRADWMTLRNGLSGTSHEVFERVEPNLLNEVSPSRYTRLFEGEAGGRLMLLLRDRCPNLEY